MIMKAFRIDSTALIYRPVVSLVFLFHWLTLALTANAQAPKLDPMPSFQSVQLQRDLVRKIYTSQIGLREIQPNSGSHVKKYLRYVNLPAGNPWCAAFVCWVYGKAGVGNPRSGWSPALFGEGRTVWASGESRANLHAGRQGTNNQELRPLRSEVRSYPFSLTTNNEQRTTPSTGDVFGLYFPEKRRIAHVGFIDEWKDPWVITVEGNTNVLGSKEGDGVYRKWRLVRSVYKVARYIR